MVKVGLEGELSRNTLFNTTYVTNWDISNTNVPPMQIIQNMSN